MDPTLNIAWRALGVDPETAPIHSFVASGSYPTVPGVASIEWRFVADQWQATITGTPEAISELKERLREAGILPPQET